VRRLVGYFTLSALLATALPAKEYSPNCGLCLAQNIFDEEAAAESEGANEPTVSENDEKERSNNKPKSDKPKKKNKTSRRKKKKPAEPAARVAERQIFTPEELARQSYAWAPEPGLRLKSTAPGIKPGENIMVAKTTIPEAVEAPKSASQHQPFRLPQIPVTQVLIVAGFVILFLIYRFRVSRQMKRRKY